jgi:molybdopterin synthase sulfur carrier subunit
MSPPQTVAGRSDTPVRNASVRRAWLGTAVGSPVVAVLRLFASAREAAGTARDDVPGRTVGEVLDGASARYGPGFASVLEQCRVWRNGEPAETYVEVTDEDEVAVLPPVSGGA